MQLNTDKLCESMLYSAIIILAVLIIALIASIVRKLMVVSCALLFGAKFAIFVDNKLTFIGVVHHELSHAIFAILTGAKITECKLFEIRKGTLGHVNIQTRGGIIIQSLQKSLCGLAPVLCGSVSLYLIYYFNLREADFTSINSIIMLILSMQISYHMAMSKRDLIVASKGICIVYILLFIVIYFTGINVSFLLGCLTIELVVIGINLGLACIIKVLSLLKPR